MKAIKSSRIYSENGVQSGYLLVDQGRFSGVVSSVDSNVEVTDYGNHRVIPGIIDTHTHGYMGYGFRFINGESDELIEYNVQGYLKSLPKSGVTGVFPTAQPNTFKSIVKVVNQGYTGARMLGIHSEGPYLNRVGEKGRPRPFPTVDINVVEEMIENAGGYMKLMALAPEIPGIDAVIELLKSKNIKIAFAHSNLNYQDTLLAIEKGVSVATHLSNVMTGLHHRDIGGTGALLLSDKVECELICDGYHVSLPYVELLLKVKDPSRFFMISDQNTLAGGKPGKYRGHFNDIQVTVDENGFLKDDDGRINGSGKSVLFGIGNLVEKLHMPLETVIKMASLNPATYYGFGKQKGSITMGKDADFVVIDDQYNAVATFVEGQKVYDQNIEVPFNPRYVY